MASVRFENVSISYGAKQVVKDFSLSVNDGEIMGIIGPSGCGKTTLIRALCGLIKPEKGNIYINDQLVFSDEKRINVAPERRGIGVVFQDYAVWPHLSVWDNVCYPMKKHKVPKEEIAKRAAYALEQVRMTGYEKHMPAQLSGGQQQRVAIARSLVSSDELIVLDEPITNLDAKLREEMILEIQMIQQNIGTTIIYITHDQEAALQLCDRIAIMQPDGQICQIGSDEEIIRRPANRFVYSFIGVSNFLPVTEKGGKVCGDLVAKGQDAVNRNREYGEELKRKAKDAVEQLTTVEIDVTKLTPEQRAELRRQMDALDQTETEAASDEEPVKDAAPAEDAEAQEQHEDENANG